MVIISYESKFSKIFKKIKDKHFKNKVRKQIKKIIKDTLVGKPMVLTRKDTQEVRIKPYRLSYKYIQKEDKLVFLSLYHKDEQ